MKPAFPLISCRRLAVLLLLACLGGLPASSRAVSSPAENGARLLQAELPTNVSLLSADCEQLAAAVGRATLIHQPGAQAILGVALTRGIRKHPHDEGKMTCACAKRIFCVSVAAAPAQASVLLDLATQLYPTCADEFAGVLRDYDQVSYDYKDRVNDKNVVDPRKTPARDTPDFSDPTFARQAADDPASAIQDPGDLSQRDISGLGFGDAYSFGSGLGPGFPGSPGFVGSPPGSGLALPPSPVTAAVNG